MASSSAQPSQGSLFRDCENLIIVCCHAFYLPTTADSSPFDEHNWRLADFQKSNPVTKKVGEHLTFVKHIQAGVEHLRGSRSLLIFSGGHTNPSVPRSEAASYLEACHALYPPSADHVENDLRRDRWQVEEYSTDSYQNLLFSICRFYDLVGRYPRHITVITHHFKRQRFTGLHATAIRWPQERLTILGINPPFSGKCSQNHFGRVSAADIDAQDEELETVKDQEGRSASKHFRTDPYGLAEPLLTKRKIRQWNPDHLDRIAERQQESVIDLLYWHGGTDGSSLFDKQLPWTLLLGKHDDATHVDGPTESHDGSENNAN